MALKPCSECQHEISDKAESCPSCGAPVKKEPKQFSVSPLFLVFLGALLYGYFGMDDEPTDTDSIAVAENAPHPESVISTPQTKPNPIQSCEKGMPVSGKFYVKGEEINFRTGPDTKSDPVINTKASKVLKRTITRTLWPSMVLEGICETGQWLQARIVEADNKAVSWETGWVHKDYVSNTNPHAKVAGLSWDIDGEKSLSKTEKVLLKKASLNILKNEPNCENISTGYRRSEPNSYYVTCDAKYTGQPFNIRFTAQEVASGKRLTQ